MAQDKVANCINCGKAFLKTSEREICDECFKKENAQIEKIKRYILSSGKTKVVLDDIVKNVPETTSEMLTDMISRGRLFSMLPKISLKCRFCGAELENDEKAGFTCKKCVMKFSPKMDELEKKGLNVRKYEEEARTLNRRLRGGMNSPNSENRFGFIKNYGL